MRSIAVALVLTAALGACGRTQDPPASPPAASGHDYEGSWKLASGFGPDGPVPIVRDHPVTMDLGGDEISGVAACNQYGGRVTVDGSSFEAGALTATEIGCPGAVGRSEARFMAGLAGADGIELQRGRLLLTGPETKLVFRRA